jgi:hypothetical protein
VLVSMIMVGTLKHSTWKKLDVTDFLDVTLELLYHIAAIVACRAGIRGTKSYDRRESAAKRIESSLRSNPSVHQSPLPVASYAASLSMTVAYRKLRDNRVASRSAALVETLSYRCEILESFKERWWSADAMARLGRKALRKIAALSNVQNLESPRAAISAGPNHEVDTLNPLAMLSSAAECHAQGDLPNQLSHTGIAAAGPRELPATDELTMEVQTRDGEGHASTDAHEVVLDSFADFDTAFGDYFDLSMPTTFYDPLFDDTDGFDLSKLPE